MAPIITNPYRFSSAAAGGWDFPNATWTSGDEFYVGTQETIPQGVSFAKTGERMYVTGSGGADAIYQYDLSTAWDVTTASYIASVSVHSAATNPTGVFAKEDGTEIYYSDSNANSFFQMTMSTPWDITTATDTSIATAPDSTVLDVFLRDDGTSIWSCGMGGDRVYMQTLSTPWDITTAGTATNIYVGGVDNQPYGVFVKPDGTQFWMVGGRYSRIYEYDMSSAWDVTTATYSTVYKASQDSVPVAITWKDDGTSMYELGLTGDKVYQWAVP
tara:strand:- start:9925 stop:10740 length:816 start_codon:yes stop_codon:yes gene_type:complete